jgi:multicomponent K+:H+ antiporter subunit F
MSFFSAALIASQVLLGAALLFALVRLLAGPRAQDRVLALDTLYVNGMLLVLAFGIREGSQL